MKKFLFTLFVTISLFANSTVINVTAVGAGVDIRPNINTAVTAASEGDTVRIPAGTFRLDQTVTITKKISLQGFGIDTTILYRDESISDATLEGWGPMFLFNINSDRNSKVSISKITFKGQIPSVVTGDGGSMAADIGVKIVNAVDFVVHNCKFYGFGDTGLQIRHKDYLARGLVFKCQFYNNSKGTLGLGLGYGLCIYGEGLRWVDGIQLGDRNAIYVEDCYFERSRHEVASAGGAQMVIRYSQFRKHIAVKNAHCIDTHQDRGPGNGTNTYGTRRYEIYGNSIINTTYYGGVTPVVNPVCDDSIQERAIGILNGDGVVFNDTVSGYRFAIGVKQQESTIAAYPYSGQVGYASGQRFGSSHSGDGRKGEGDLYYWGIVFTAFSNTCGGTGLALFYNYDAVANGGTGVYLVDNRDYHQNTIKPNYKPYPYPHPRRAKIKY